MNKKLSIFLISTLLILALLPLTQILPVHATSSVAFISLQASQDCYVASDHSGTNYNTEALLINTGAGNTKRSFIGFNFGNIPPNSEVINATFHIYLTTSSESSENLRYYRIIETWDEDETTWANQPTTGTYDQYSITGTPEWKSIDVTDEIDDLVGLYGIMIRGAGESTIPSHSLSFASSELPNYEPYLEIYFYLDSGVGTTQVTLVGDGAQVEGGSIFDIMATNSSHEDGESSARVDSWMYNLQHVHVLTTLHQNAVWNSTDNQWDCPSIHSNTGYLEYGISYLEDDINLVPGWYVHIEVNDGASGTSDSYVQLEVSWYNHAELIKTDTIYTAYEAYQANDTTTQFSLYVDLWLSSQTGSTLVGGTVSSQYYSMTQSGWWLWENWAPVYGLNTTSTFYDYLYNLDEDVVNASTFSIFDAWTKIAKITEGSTSDGYSSCDTHTWYTTVKALQFVTIPYGTTLYGIETPVLMPPTTPDAPLGFFASLGNQLANSLNHISISITDSAALSSQAVDNLFDAIGISNATEAIGNFVGTLAGYFTNSISYITGFLLPIFTFFASTVTFIIEWFGGVITWIISLGAGVVGILSGSSELLDAFSNNVLTQTWSKFAEVFATGFIFIFLIVAWFDSIDKRAKQYGGGWMSFFMSDINNMISVFSFIIDLAWRIVTTVIDLLTRFISVF